MFWGVNRPGNLPFDMGRFRGACSPCVLLSMARIRTLDRDMGSLDTLKFLCRGCGAYYEATKDQAVRRFGPYACPMMVRHGLRCRACGSPDISVGI